MRGVGGAVASAGATILAARAALGLATLGSYQALDPVTAVAVALMMLAAVTLIPEVLTVFGRRSYWPMLPREETWETAPADWRRSICGQVGAVVLLRPGLTLVTTVLTLSVLTAGLVPFHANYDQLASLPGNTESVRGFELLRESFPAGVLSPVRVYVSMSRGARVMDSNSLERLDAITLKLAVHPAVPFFVRVSERLSVDYNIYLMSRVREQAREAPLEGATRYALACTGPVITLAGIILAGTFSALTTLAFQDLLQLGYAEAVGLLIDSFITRNPDCAVVGRPDRPVELVALPAHVIGVRAKGCPRSQ